MIRWPWHRLLLAYLMGVTGLIGCGRGGAGVADSEKPAQRPAVEPKPDDWVRLGDSSLSIQWRNKHPAAVRFEHGPAIFFQDGQAAVEGRLVVEIGPGEVRVVRLPAIIARELNALPYVYLEAESLQPVMTPGFQGEPFVNQKDMKTYWTAFTCTNPLCPGHKSATGKRPFLFANPRGNVSSTSAGPSQGAAEIALAASKPCPRCGRIETVGPYVTSETLARSEALLAELESVRALSNRAAQSHQDRKDVIRK